MRYAIDMALFGTLPAYTRVVLVARNLDNTQNAATSRNMLRKAVQAAGATFADRTPARHPRFAPWLRAYEAFGIQEEAAQEQEQGIPAQLYLRTGGTPLTDILNAFALQNLLPAGGDDVDRIVGNVWLRPARGNELFIPAGHPERLEAPAIGEIIYVDDGPYVLRRHWHGPPADTARITSQTRNALLYLDALPPIDLLQVEELTDQLSRLLTGFLGAQVEIHFLTQKQPAVDIHF